MPKYLFLDNWALSDYTKGESRSKLSEFIRRNNYTILIDSLSFTELYNPGWKKAVGPDRTARAAELLGQHSCVIVDPQKVWRAEFEAFPAKLEQIPVELSLDDLPNRALILLRFLRRDKLFLQQGKDVAQWAARYESVKSNWSQDVAHIIEHACKTGALARDARGKFVNLDYYKEAFLRTLDGRHLEHHFNLQERENLQVSMEDVKNGVGAQMPAVRASSLYFWHAYIATDRAFTMKRRGSDIGDYYQMSLMPYCSAFTIDTTMDRLVNRVLVDMGCQCQVLNRERLDSQIREQAT